MKNSKTEYSSSERTPVVLPEMEQLLPPLSGEQFSALEGDILENGCYAPIIVNEDMVIVDGHNRFRICEKHGLPFKMLVFSFANLLEAKQWALETQRGRRSLSLWDLGQIALKLKPELEAAAKRNQDDNTENESNSIQNQKMILQSFASDHHFPNLCFYVDDGYSGASFQRPGFQQMMADMENGEIGIIITKDLSRLGRNQLHTGLYIEERFPMFGVRYIAINDNVDTDSSESNELMPFKNLFNEWYVRDSSRKVRAVLRAKAERGERLGNRAPYGYRKDENDSKTAVRKRSTELDAIFKNLYEDRVLGHISVEQFQTLSGGYTEEQTNFDYYYGDESNQFSFFRIPRQLVTEERFKRLSTDAKLLYGLLMDRMALSAKAFAPIFQVSLYAAMVGCYAYFGVKTYKNKGCHLWTLLIIPA